MYTSYCAVEVNEANCCTRCSHWHSCWEIFIQWLWHTYCPLAYSITAVLKHDPRYAPAATKKAVHCGSNYTRHSVSHLWRKLASHSLIVVDPISRLVRPIIIIWCCVNSSCLPCIKNWRSFLAGRFQHAEPLRQSPFFP